MNLFDHAEGYGERLERLYALGCEDAGYRHPTGEPVVKLPDGRTVRLGEAEAWAKEQETGGGPCCNPGM